MFRFLQKRNAFIHLFLNGCEREFCRRVVRKILTVLCLGTERLCFSADSFPAGKFPLKRNKELSGLQTKCLVDRNHKLWILCCTQSAMDQPRLSRVDRSLSRNHPFASLKIWTLHFSSWKLPEDGPSHVLGPFWFYEFAHCLIMNE